MSVDQTRREDQRLPVLAAAWLVVLVTSILPKVVLEEVFQVGLSDVARRTGAASAIGMGLVVAAVWSRWRPLVPLLVLSGAIVGAEWLVFGMVATAPAVRARLADPSFSTYMVTEQSLRTTVAFLVVVALVLLRRRPSQFFLARGNLAASMGAIPWLGVKEGTRWSRFAPVAAIALCGGTLAFLLASGRPSLSPVGDVLPLMPTVLLTAALNAFYEELTYKASMLSVLEAPVGRTQAVWMVSAYFGIGHYYGVPYGLVGVAMAFALGWLLGRSVVETRGLFWAWFLHFCQDVLIFSFLALGSMKPGG